MCIHIRTSIPLIPQTVKRIIGRGTPNAYEQLFSRSFLKNFWPGKMKTIEEAGREQSWCPHCESTDRAFNKECDDPMGWHDEEGNKMGDQQLEEYEGPQKARWIVYEYVKGKLARRGTHPTFSFDEVRLVWFCKTLQNWKAIVITTLPDQYFYEITYNGDKNEAYLDAYVKEDNVVVPDNDLGRLT